MQKFTIPLKLSTLSLDVSFSQLNDGALMVRIHHPLIYAPPGYIERDELIKFAETLLAQLRLDT